MRHDLTTARSSFAEHKKWPYILFTSRFLKASAWECTFHDVFSFYPASLPSDRLRRSSDFRADGQIEGDRWGVTLLLPLAQRYRSAATMSTVSSAQATADTDDRPGPPAHAWEDTGEHSWETAVQEDAEGNIILADRASAAEAIRRRRKRLEQTDYAQRGRRVVRDMIRYLYVIVDASRWMRQKDPVLPPGTRLDVTLNLLQEFVQEYYDQNPLSHLGFVLVRNGEAEILTPLSSSSKAHKVALQSVSQLAASEGPNKGGEFSLQNGLEVAGRSLGHQPRHGSREIVVLCAALSTCDPGNILVDTFLASSRLGIRVSAFALAAEMHVCRRVAEDTGGVMGVCLDKAHYRDWLLTGQCVPPPASATTRARVRNGLHGLSHPNVCRRSHSGPRDARYQATGTDRLCLSTVSGQGIRTSHGLCGMWTQACAGSTLGTILSPPLSGTAVFGSANREITVFQSRS